MKFMLRKLRNASVVILNLGAKRICGEQKIFHERKMFAGQQHVILTQGRLYRPYVISQVMCFQLIKTFL